jgi:protein-L-isoaspartate O-methyltransferase
VTSSSVDVTWPVLAARLADQLTAAGKLTDPAWRAAVRAVPRHELVPTFYTQDSTGAWTRSDVASADGDGAVLEKVYTNTALITALRQDTQPPRVLSSSSQPGLMTRMLEALDVHDGHKVLEIGTGTGYNAALMAHRLGSRRVYSVDVEPELVDLARDRLHRLGFTPCWSRSMVPTACPPMPPTTGSSAPAPCRRCRGAGSNNSPRAAWSWWT